VEYVDRRIERKVPSLIEVGRKGLRGYQSTGTSTLGKFSPLVDDLMSEANLVQNVANSLAQNTHIEPFRVMNKDIYIYSIPREHPGTEDVCDSTAEIGFL